MTSSKVTGCAPQTALLYSIKPTFEGVFGVAYFIWAQTCQIPSRYHAKAKVRKGRFPLMQICPIGMRSFWKVAAFRLTESIQIQSARRALRCFQNVLHHFIILSLKWY